MQKCVEENCSWIKEYGKCADVCIKQGYAHTVTNYDQLKEMTIDEVAMVMANLILQNDRTVKNKVQAVCLKMELFDRCMRWLSTEVENDRS